MKKLTAGIFTVLMGLVSVNAADAAVASQGYVDFKVGENTADISELSDTVQANKAAADAVAGRVTTAEGKITTAEGKITTLEGKVSTMEGGNLTIKDGAITEAKLATELANKIDAAQTEAQVGAAIDAEIAALDLANTYDAKGAASTAESNAKTYADGLNTAMDTRVDALEGAGYQNATQVGTAIATKIGDLNLGTTYEALDNKTQLVNEDSTENQYPSAKAVFTAVNGLKGAISTENTERDTAILNAQTAAEAAQDEAEKNALAIQAINNETTGILATAMAEIDKKANSADVYSKTDADSTFMTSDEVEDKIEAAVADNGAVKTVVDTAILTLENGAVKDNANAIKAIQESDYAESGITADLVAKYNAYETTISDNAAAATSAAAQALTDAKAYTNLAIGNLNLNELSRVPAECSAEGTYCVLTSDGTNYLWEAIERATGEAQPAGTAIPSVTQ